jgi:septal ring factor EnvC (AmiA/AmiB activator)
MLCSPKVACFLGVFFFVGVLPGAAQVTSPPPRQQELQRLRDEIARFRERLAAEEKREASLLDVLARLNRDIDLTQRLVTSLEREAQAKQRQIDQLEETLKRLNRELEQLKRVAAKRLVYTYKYGRVKDLELLFTARSLHQGALWLAYQRRLIEHDRRNLDGIVRRQTEIEQQRVRLRLELAEKQQILSEKQKEAQALQKKRRQRQAVLKKVRQDKELIRERLREYERAAQEIMRLIAEAEASRSNRAPEQLPSFGDFGQLRGKLPWPTQGTVIGKYGPNRHPVLKTVTENLGIDIRAPLGAEVRSVADGQVTAISWQRGRGNIVIVNHSGGYYTVYTHLQDILVAPDEVVRAGQVLGTVGETGSLQGPMLHFEIWKANKSLNPESWLR